MRKREWILAGTILTVAAPAIAAGPDKQLQNVKGEVAYGLPSASPQPIAPRATIALSDADTAITGNMSLGALTLADSSRVLVGSNTKVQLNFFNQADVDNASFLLYDGHIRFAVEHPKGARANFVFQTPTATVGVRGTEGDILATPAIFGLNVYVLSNPNLPVSVRFADGRVVVVRQGQSLTADLTKTPVALSLTTISSSTLAPFAEFGPPPQPPRPNRAGGFWRAVLDTVLNNALNQAIAPSGSATQPAGKNPTPVTLPTRSPR